MATNFKSSLFVSHRQCSMIMFALFVLLLLTVIAFLATIILSSYTGAGEQVLHDADGVRIVRVNNLNGLHSVHQYISRYYSNAWSQLQAVRSTTFADETFELRTVNTSLALKVSQLNAPVVTRTDCTHQTCFDMYQCDTADSRIKIYIYPIRRIVNYTDQRPLIGEYSREYYRILKAIELSPFYTNDIGQACAFVIPIDTLNERHYQQFGLDSLSSLFAEYAYFKKFNGSNHLFFNFIAGTNGKMNLNTGNALLMSADLNTFHHRLEFDIALPVYSPKVERIVNHNNFALHINHMMHKQRSFQVLVLHANSLSNHTLNLLNVLTSKYPQLVNLHHDCSQFNGRAEQEANAQCDSDQELLMSSSQFCLIYHSLASNSKTLLTDALMFGCIPILIDNWLVLPFDTKINWSKISLRVHDMHINNMSEILNAIDPDRLYGMRRDGLVIWAKYLSTIERIVHTSLTVLNERLFPQTMVSKDKWNDLDLNFDPFRCYRLPEGFEQDACFERNAFDNQWDVVDGTLPDLFASKSGFTAVILTYDRLDSLLKVIAQVLQAPSLKKIFIIWNNGDKLPPKRDDFLFMISSITHKALHVPIDVMVTVENVLSNRFYPFKEIETDAILSIDDDITMLNGDEIEFGFQIWREFPDSIVGFPSRVHKFDNTTGRWNYDSEWVNEMSMVLTGAAFFHKYYDYLYSFYMPMEIKDWVDKHMNCEDIAMNFLVSNVTGKPPIKVTPRKKFKCPECINQPMISSDTKSHLAERSDCINLFSKIYGHMPLKYVEYRVDPLLFKDNLPEKLKKYNRIGNI